MEDHSHHEFVEDGEGDAEASSAVGAALGVLVGQLLFTMGQIHAQLCAECLRELAGDLVDYPDEFAMQRAGVLFVVADFMEALDAITPEDEEDQR